MNNRNFRRLKEKVFEKKPILREIIEKHGARSLYSYVKRFSNGLIKPCLKRQEEFINAFKKETETYLGKETAETAAEQLKNFYYVSTADHHGPLSNPWFINPHIITAATYAEQTDKHLNYIIVLACSNVSLNNFSFPRGLLFHSFANNEMKLHRLSFLPSNAHTSSIYNFRAYQTRDITKLKKLLQEKTRNGEIRQNHEEKLQLLIDEIYNQPDMMECRYFSDQIIKSNFKLWRRFFKPVPSAYPDLIYLDQERLVSRLLIENHLYADTIINRIIFDPKYTALIHTYFKNLNSCFPNKEEKGSYLFWAFPKNKNCRTRLFKENDFLVSEDHSYSIALHPDVFKKALLEKELMPSFVLNFIVLSFYYGLACLGGPGQINYLTDMKNAYLKMHCELQDKESVATCENISTNELSCDFNLAFLSDANGSFVPATGLDLILYGTSDTWPNLVKLSKLVSLEESLDPEMPQYYHAMYSTDSREPELAMLNHEDISKFIGLNRKIQPIAYI